MHMTLRRVARSFACQMVRVVRAGRHVVTAALPVSVAIVGFALGGTMASDEAAAKRPGSTYCFVGKCHRVKTLGEMRRLIGKDVMLTASHYNHCKLDRYNPCGLTSSGTPFKPQRPDNAASPIYPDGTRLLIWNPATRAAALIRIDNAGPYWGNRKLDVSIATAEKLGFKHRGVARLKTRVISAPNRRESRYRRNRKYEPVAGYLGRFDSINDAEAALAAVMAVRAMAASALAPVSAAVVASSHAEPANAEKVRRRHKRKQARLIASLDLGSEDGPSFVRGGKRQRIVLPRRKSTPPAAIQVAALAPAASTDTVVTVNKRLADGQMTPPLPLMSPQQQSRQLLARLEARLPGNGAAEVQLPLPTLGPARWRVAARDIPLPPVAKPTRIAQHQRESDLDGLAWLVEQVLIEKHFRTTGRAAMNTLQETPFEEQDPMPARRVLPSINAARGGRLT